MHGNIKDRRIELKNSLNKEAEDNILSFWLKQIDIENGGFFGHIEKKADKNAEKGLVMTARHVWSFSVAYRQFKKSAYKDAAEHAYKFLINNLYDREHRGFFWSCDYRGQKKETIKKVYGNAFAIYALAEYHVITGSQEALDIAWETYRILEDVARDNSNNGYYEAFDREWKNSIPEPLGAEDLACPKSMNTHLHILEAYSTLYRITGEKHTAEAIKNLLSIFSDHIMADGSHLGLYFAEDWQRLDNIISYGHDIEASWLLTEAAELIYGENLPEDFKKLIQGISEFYKKYIPENNYSLANEKREDNTIDTERVWWVQAEAFVGMLNAYQLFLKQEYLETALKVWDFISRYISDREEGEWHWAVTPEGKPVTKHPKGGMWKSSYHNTRACIEGINRIQKILAEEK